MKKTNKKMTHLRFISLVLLAAACLSLASCATYDGIKKDTEKLYGDIKEDLNLSYTPAVISLCSTEPEVVVEEEVTVMTQILTAQIKAGVLTDNTIDWTIAWGEGSYGEETAVSDYVTLAPVEGDPLSVVVTCHQPIAADSCAVITATTREGGYTAQCVVTYVGKPQSIVAKLNGEEITAAVGQLGEMLTIELDLDNVFHQVGDVYGMYIYDYTLSGTALADRVEQVHTLSVDETSGTPVSVWKDVEGSLLEEQNFSFSSYIGVRDGFVPMDQTGAGEFSTNVLKVYMPSLGDVFPMPHISNSRLSYSLTEIISYEITIIVTETLSGLTQTLTVSLFDLSLEPELTF